MTPADYTTAIRIHLPTLERNLRQLSKPARYAVIYEWPPGTDIAGTVEVRYTRVRTDTRLAREVLSLQRAARRGRTKSPYSISTRPEHIL